MPLSGSQITQLRPGGLIGRPYGSFSGKTPFDPFRNYYTPVPSTSLTVKSTHQITLASAGPGDQMVMMLTLKQPDGLSIDVSTGFRSGWAEKGNETRSVAGNQYRVRRYFRYCDGTENTRAYEFTTTNDCQVLVTTFVIPAFDKLVTDTDEVNSNGLTRYSSTSTPPHGTYTPSWGEDDTLWIAMGWSMADDTTVTSYPPGFVDGAIATMGLGTGESAAQWLSFKKERTAAQTPGNTTLGTTPSTIYTTTMGVKPYKPYTVLNDIYLMRNLDRDEDYFESNKTTEEAVASVIKTYSNGIARQGWTQSSDLDVPATVDPGALVGGTGNIFLAGDTATRGAFMSSGQIESSNSGMQTVGAERGKELLGGSPTHSQAVTEFVSGVNAQPLTMDAGKSFLGLSSPTAGFQSPDGGGGGNQDVSPEAFAAYIKAFVVDDNEVMQRFRRSHETIQVDRPGTGLINLNLSRSGTFLTDQPDGGAFHTKGGSGGGTHQNVVLVMPNGDRLFWVSLNHEGAGPSDFRELLRQLRTLRPDLFARQPKSDTVVTQLVPGGLISRPYGDFSGKASGEGSVGTAAGVATVSGAGAAIKTGTGVAAGAATVAGQTEGTSDAVGTAAGTSTVSGSSISASEAVGTAAGSATVAGISGLISAAEGNAAGQATVAATGEVLPFWTAVGAAAGQATVLGVGDFLLPPEPPDTIQRIPPVIRPSIPQPSDRYDPQWAGFLVQALEIALDQLEDYRLVKMTSAELNNFPDNGAGLNPGEVFINENGVLQVVRPGDIFVGNAALVAELGSVTVATP